MDMVARSVSRSSDRHEARVADGSKVQTRDPQPYDRFELLPIAGSWRHGQADHRLVDTNPFTGDVLLEIKQADRRDLDAAFAAGAKAQLEWAASAPGVRAQVFRRAANVMEARRGEIVEWLIRESGSTRLKANLEWEVTHTVMLWATSVPHAVESRCIPSDIPGKENQVRRKPVGVVGAISPWNWPLHLSNRTIAPALAVGNAVVVKPSSDTPVTGGLLLAKIFEEAGLPAGLLSVIVGAGSEIGDAFVSHPVPRVISFTGSTPVGRRIAELAAKAPIIKRVDLELGGNAPFVVLADADLDQAVEAAVFGKFLHQGQICIAINRIIVEEPVYRTFVDRFTERVARLKIGDSRDDETMIGPIINNSQLQKLVARVRRAGDDGCKQVLGGDPDGLVLPPHVFVNVTNKMELAAEEIFGPVAPILRVGSAEEALAVANDTSFGLSGAVFTRDLHRGVHFAERMQVGMAHVNDQPVIDLPTCPFGGEKNSGIGRFNGSWAIEAFTTDQWLTAQHAPRGYPWSASAVQGPWS
jgi:aldehyde dehydrogenase (NAD+)